MQISIRYLQFGQGEGLGKIFTLLEMQRPPQHIGLVLMWSFSWSNQMGHISMREFIELSANEGEGRGS